MGNELSMEEVFVKKLTEILESHLENENFGVEDLANEMALSRSQLHRKLNAINGKSTSQFIREFRLEKAMEMLQNKVATASEIAYRVGFGSPTYFNTCFHQYFGYPPGEVRFRHFPINEGEHIEQNLEPFHISSSLQQDQKKLLFSWFLWVSLVALLAVIGYFILRPAATTKVLTTEHIKEKSIALLPFKSINNDDESQYLAEGIMASIQARFNLINNLKVISSKTMEKFQETNKSSPEIAKELNVTFLLDGSVQKYDNKIKIILHLIDAAKDAQIWSKDFESDYNNIFALESKISIMVANELELVVTPIELQRIVKIPTQNIEAYNLFLKGRHFKEIGGSLENYDISIKYFEQAIELDPEFALAYSGLAMSKLGHQLFDFTDRKQIAIIKELSNKAILLDTTIAETHSVLGIIESIYNLNWEEAEREFQVALNLDPNLSDTYFHYGIFLHNVKGDFIMARQYINHALALDPLSYKALVKSAEFYMDTSDFASALEETRKAKEIDKYNLWAYWVDFENYVKQGKSDLAIDEITMSWNLSHGNTDMINAARAAYKNSGIKGVYQYINDIDIKNGSDIENAYWVAQKYSFLGSKEIALDYLEAGYKNDFVQLYPIKYDWHFKNLHTEPRFLKLLQKMKLGSYKDESSK